MERLDYKYLAKLVERAQSGDNNAFAELFTATYQNEFAYSFRILGDVGLAKSALKDTYGRALREINKLLEPELVLVWLYKLNFVVSKEQIEKVYHLPVADTVTVDGRDYTLGQIINNLPLTEAQTLIMHFYQNYSIKDVAKMLGLSQREIKYSVRQGNLHLMRLMQE